MDALVVSMQKSICEKIPYFNIGKKTHEKRQQLSDGKP